jgi:hypothetical protein
VFTALGVILTWMVIAGSADPAASNQVPVRVDFSAPVGCTDADTFWAGIVSRTERARAARAGDAAMRVTVRVTRAGAKVHGELRISVPNGHLEARRVDGATCTEVVEVLSLTAALAIDPSIAVGGITVAPPPSGGSTGGGSTSSPAANGAPGSGTAPGTGSAQPPAPPATPPSPPQPPPPPPPPPAAPPPAEVPAPVAPPPPASAWPARGPAVAASLITAHVFSSTLSVGGAVSGRLASSVRPQAPSVTASFIWMAGDFFHPGDDLAIRWLALAVDACPGWRLGGFASVEPCARLTGGVMTLSDNTIMSPKVVDRLWGGGGVVAHVEVGRGDGFWLKVDVGLEIPFVQRNFTADGPFHPVGSTASVYPTLAFGLAHSL